MANRYVAVSGAVFAVVAVGQAARAAMEIPAMIGTFAVPVAASWVAALFAGALAVWAFRSGRPPG